MYLHIYLILILPTGSVQNSNPTVLEAGFTSPNMNMQQKSCFSAFLQNVHPSKLVFGGGEKPEKPHTFFGGSTPLSIEDNSAQAACGSSLQTDQGIGTSNVSFPFLEAKNFRITILP